MFEVCATFRWVRTRVPYSVMARSPSSSRNCSAVALFVRSSSRPSGSISPMMAESCIVPKYAAQELLVPKSIARTPSKTGVSLTTMRNRSGGGISYGCGCATGAGAPIRADPGNSASRMLH